MGDIAETFRRHQQQRTPKGRTEERLRRELAARLPEMDLRTFVEFYDLIVGELERRKPSR